jgi:hypothetical protein
VAGLSVVASYCVGACSATSFIRVSTSRSTARSNGAPRRPRYQIGD